MGQGGGNYLKIKDSVVRKPSYNIYTISASLTAFFTVATRTVRVSLTWSLLVWKVYSDQISCIGWYKIWSLRERYWLPHNMFQYLSETQSSMVQRPALPPQETSQQKSSFFGSSTWIVPTPPSFLHWLAVFAQIGLRSRHCNVSSFEWSWDSQPPLFLYKTRRLTMGELKGDAILAHSSDPGSLLICRFWTSCN